VNKFFHFEIAEGLAELVAICNQ